MTFFRKLPRPALFLLAAAAIFQFGRSMGEFAYWVSH
jgi:hypothetical protein